MTHEQFGSSRGQSVGRGSLLRRIGAPLSMLVLGTLVAACTGPGSDNASGETTGAAGPAVSGDISIAVVSHGGSGDAFWDVVKNGAEQAGKDEGVEVSYQASGGDPAKQSQLIDAAVAQGVSGIVVSMANPDGIKDSVEAAVAAGIPVITINSGETQSKEFGAITHVGQSELIAGQGAGEKLKEEGGTKLICVIHEAGNVGLEDRCKGATEKFGTVTTLQVDVNDITDAQAKIKGALQADATVDSILTLNPAVAIAATNAVSEISSAAKVATFDLSGDVVKAIKDGTILFAVDQQQYLQGYLPVVFLKLYITNANTVGGGQPVLTGPGFVTKENADTVEELASAGTR